MKKMLGILLLSLPTVLLSAQPKVNYKKAGAAIPPFVLEQPNGQPLTNTALKAGKPLLLMIFSPDCEHCAMKLDTLKGLTGIFKTTQMLLVTELRNKPNLNSFLKKKGFDKVPLFRKAGLDRGDLISNIYTYQLLPQYNFYNAKGRLVKTFTGNAPVDSLRMYIR